MTGMPTACPVFPPESCQRAPWPALLLGAFEIQRPYQYPAFPFFANYSVACDFALIESPLHPCQSGTYSPLITAFFHPRK